MRKFAMSSRRRRTFSLAIFGLTLFALIAGPQAQAQGNIFDFLFGGEEPRAAPVSPRMPSAAPRAPSRIRVARHAPPENLRYDRPEGEGFSVSSSGFCVRTCDGFFFPLVRGKNASAQTSCEYACPGASMEAYEGSTIERARNRIGQSYSKLGTAFNFQDRTTKQCSCSHPETALADYQRMIPNDPTLRRGDIVIFEAGIMAYSGQSGPSALTPLDHARFVSNDMRRLIRKEIDVRHLRWGSRAASPPASSPSPASFSVETPSKPAEPTQSPIPEPAPAKAAEKQQPEAAVVDASKVDAAKVDSH